MIFNILNIITFLFNFYFFIISVILQNIFFKKLSFSFIFNFFIILFLFSILIIYISFLYVIFVFNIFIYFFFFDYDSIMKFLFIIFLNLILIVFWNFFYIKTKNFFFYMPKWNPLFYIIIDFITSQELREFILFIQCQFVKIKVIFLHHLL